MAIQPEARRRRPIQQLLPGLPGDQPTSIIGRLLRQTGKPAEAMKAYEAALAIHRKLVAAEPRRHPYRQRPGD